MYNLSQTNPYYQFPYQGFNLQQRPLNFFKGKPVASAEEARSSAIDFDGTTHIFTDTANKKIYTKKVNPDGTVAFDTYDLVQESEEKPPTYVTKEELEEAINELKTAFADKQTKEEQTLNF